MEDLKMNAEEIKPPQQDKDVEERKSDDPLDDHYPLWLEFRKKAPGSHKHTQSLSNTVDNVAVAVGCDTKRLKMAARYHDIGKLWNPSAFTENQGDEDNIHDELDPIVSFHILTRHVSDTVTILVAHDFPIEVIQIASQHHGKTILKAIFEKAKEIDKSIQDEGFRYKTDKPKNLESLILMLCDQVEATSRSVYLKQKKAVEPDVLIGSIFQALLKDGQFDDVEIKLGLVAKIQQILAEDIAGNFQKRLKYKENDDLPETEEKKES